MKELFLNYELSKLAKDKGFNEKCLAYYNPVVAEGSEPLFLPVDNDLINFREVDLPCIKAPLYQQIISWLRNSHGWSVETMYRRSGNIFYSVLYPMSGNPTSEVKFSGTDYDTYEEALNAVILVALNLIP